jgi:hypothetical protein
MSAFPSPDSQSDFGAIDKKKLDEYITKRVEEILDQRLADKEKEWQGQRGNGGPDDGDDEARLREKRDIGLEVSSKYTYRNCLVSSLLSLLVSTTSTMLFTDSYTKSIVFHRKVTSSKESIR